MLVIDLANDKKSRSSGSLDMVKVLSMRGFWRISRKLCGEIMDVGTESKVPTRKKFKFFGKKSIRTELFSAKDHKTFLIFERTENLELNLFFRSGVYIHNFNHFYHFFGQLHSRGNMVALMLK